jgi:MFS family permease
MGVSTDSWGTGFDSSLMSAMNANDRFHSDLDIPKTGGYLGIVTAIYTIGNLVGSFFAGPASDRYGRRVGMFVGSIIAIMGGIVVCTAKQSQAYMAGRFFIGFGVSICRSAAPAFVTEISPPQWRGPVTLLYNSLWLIGAILASGVANATGPIKSSLSWRIPLILQIIPFAIVLLTCWHLPESPRWLIANDRFEEAEAIMTKYHANGVPNTALVTLEIAEMRESIKQEASDKRWYDYSELVSSRSERYRTFLVVSMAFIGKQHMQYHCTQYI